MYPNIVIIFLLIIKCIGIAASTLSISFSVIKVHKENKNTFSPPK